MALPFRTWFLVGVALPATMLQAGAPMTGHVGAPNGEMQWWYRQPARDFWDGLPLGTGRFGAMVLGEARDETIVFNDQTLWTGSPYDPVNPNGLAALPKIRQAVMAGQYSQAGKLCDDNLLTYPYPHVQNYQAMGRLLLQFAGHEEVADYRRQLDMDSALARVQYRVGGALYQREVFASHPDQAVVIRLTCDKPGRLTLKVSLDSIQPSATSRAEGDDELVMGGGTIEQGGIPNLMLWQSRVRVIAQGGTVRRGDMSGGHAHTFVGQAWRRRTGLAMGAGIGQTNKRQRPCPIDRRQPGHPGSHGWDCGDVDAKPCRRN